MRCTNGTTTEGAVYVISFQSPGTAFPLISERLETATSTLDGKEKSSALLAPRHEIKGYQYEMVGHAEKCVERYLELSGKDIKSLKQVETPCIDDHQLQEDDFVTIGRVAEQIFL